jgi:hypothetical protein
MHFDESIGEDWGLRGQRKYDPWIPLLTITSGDQWDDFWNPVRTETMLKLGDPTMTSKAENIIGELIDNSVTHGNSPSGTTVCAQYYSGEKSTLPKGLWIAIADSGMGIPNHLRRNPKFTPEVDDRVLIDNATHRGVTGTRDQRGYGLPESFDEAQQLSPSRIIIRSGSAQGEFEWRADRTPVRNFRETSAPVPGTWVHIRVRSSDE